MDEPQKFFFIVMGIILLITVGISASYVGVLNEMERKYPKVVVKLNPEFDHQNIVEFPYEISQSLFNPAIIVLYVYNPQSYTEAVIMNWNLIGLSEYNNNITMTSSLGDPFLLNSNEQREVMYSWEIKNETSVENQDVVSKALIRFTIISQVI